MIYTWIILASILWYFRRLPGNYIRARKTGATIVIVPVSPESVIWLVIQGFFQDTLKKWVPAFIWNSFRPATRGWEYTYRSFIEKLDRSVWMLVNPGRSQLIIADPEMAREMMSRPNDFVQLDLATRIMSLFGPNLTGSNGKQWQRHRKVVAPILNERIMSIVWDESLEQSQDMMANITAKTSDEQVKTKALLKGIRVIAINIMGVAGFGTSTPWDPSEDKKPAPPGYLLSFMQTMNNIVSAHILAVFVPTHILRHSFMPKVVRTLGIAVDEFPRHVRDFMKAERHRLASSPGAEAIPSTNTSAAPTNGIPAAPRKSLLTHLVSRVDEKGDFTEEEIVGNLFNFSLAGFDTTANTVAYAVLLLAIHPDTQSWVMEEVQDVVASDPSLSYAGSYPKLIRMLALMHETLRLFTPIGTITRQVNQPQTLSATTLSREVHVAMDTTVFVSPTFIHAYSRIWGNDALEFLPCRWIGYDASASKSTSSFSSSNQTSKRTETLKEEHARFLPWASGPRGCPGIKFSQVEFVGVMFGILKDWEIGVGEGGVEAVKKALKESQVRVALQIRDIEGVELVLRRRKGRGVKV